MILHEGRLLALSKEIYSACMLLHPFDTEQGDRAYVDAKVQIGAMLGTGDNLDDLAWLISNRMNI